MTTPGAPATDPASPLQGLRVLDFTSMIAGPYCTRALADLGAEVIKIESLEGDYMRQREPLRGGHSAYFGHLNAGKRSAVFDLKAPADQTTIHELVASADVLVEAMRPGVMARLGLGYATLARLHPRLVYCSISGFGQEGPEADRPAYAQIVQAACGFEAALASYQRGGEAAGRPLNIATFVADILCGSFACTAILAALRQRDATGCGQHIDASLFESVLQLMPYEVQEAQQPAQEPRPVYRPLRASDGYLMVAPVSPRNVQALLEAIGVDRWRDDPLLATERARQRHWDAFLDRIEQWTAPRSCAQCLRVLGEAGVPVARYQSVREALDAPQTRFRALMQPVHDAAGHYAVPRLPFLLSAARVGVGHEVPTLGQHTEAVRAEARSRARPRPAPPVA